MTTYKEGVSSSHPYKEPTSLPDSIPKVQEIGVTSAPLKSAAFFLGAYCKEYNGASRPISLFCPETEHGDC
jgi:NADH dehydrogenase (ubiquinone) 1 alpha subcomplex subunit 8